MTKTVGKNTIKSHRFDLHGMDLRGGERGGDGKAVPIRVFGVQGG